MTTPGLCGESLVRWWLPLDYEAFCRRLNPFRASTLGDPTSRPQMMDSNTEYNVVISLPRCQCSSADCTEK